MIKPDRTIHPSHITDSNHWDSLVSHPLQSWAWGEFRRAMGVDVVRIEDVGQITFHPIPHTPWTVGYFPKGPNPSRQMIEKLQKLGQHKKAIFIQLEPNTTQLLVTSNQLLNLKPSQRPLFTKYTFVLDLTKSEDELLASMHSKTRYNIRVAQRHEVKVKEDNSDHAFEAYIALTQETTQRQAFYAHNTLYHRRMWEVMKKAGIAHLFTATYQDKILSAWIVFVWGDTLYYPYGASSREHREVMAPTLLLWEIALWAQKNHLKSFDLWGALGPNPNEADAWYGFHRFKQGFSPKLVEFIGSYDLIINKLLYPIYTIADTLRWFILKHSR